MSDELENKEHDNIEENATEEVQVPPQEEENPNVPESPEKSDEEGPKEQSPKRKLWL